MVPSPMANSATECGQGKHTPLDETDEFVPEGDWNIDE
jgi:hypothetical protein